MPNLSARYRQVFDFPLYNHDQYRAPSSTDLHMCSPSQVSYRLIGTPSGLDSLHLCHIFGHTLSQENRPREVILSQIRRHKRKPLFFLSSHKLYPVPGKIWYMLLVNTTKILAIYCHSNKWRVNVEFR